VGTFRQCPTCRNIKEDDEVFMCKECGVVFCEVCNAGYVLCPDCGAESRKPLPKEEMRYPQDRRMFSCDKCDKSFFEESPNSYIACPKCGGKPEVLGSIE